MNFLDYIKGKRKGIEAHQIEKDSMSDPFMYEAIDGFDSVNGNHAERIRNIQNRLHNKRRFTKKHLILWQSVAACAVMILAIGGYFFFDNTSANNNLYAQTEDIRSEFIEIYIPETYYTENIVVIAKHNSEAAKTYKPAIEKTRAKNTDNEESETQPTTEGYPIDVYIPQQ